MKTFDQIGAVQFGLINRWNQEFSFVRSSHCGSGSVILHQRFYQPDERFMTRRNTIAGLRFGRLVALEEFQLTKSRHVKVKCRCDCGVEKFVRQDHIKAGKVKSCGCLSSEACVARQLIHGCTRSTEWKVWVAIKTRCLNPKSSAYKYYGGRGITICDRWRNSFENFFSDMGTRPTPLHSIERKNNDLGYSPDNCKWATKLEQANNTRTEYLGKRQTLAQWSRETGIHKRTIRARLFELGWETKKALGL